MSLVITSMTHGEPEHVICSDLFTIVVSFYNWLTALFANIFGKSEQNIPFIDHLIPLLHILEFHWNQMQLYSINTYAHAHTYTHTDTQTYAPTHNLIPFYLNYQIVGLCRITSECTHPVQRGAR